jgi:hypothetical protein
MVRLNRRSAMRVRDGRVLKKNNWRLEASDYRALRQDEIRLDRRRPPWGSRHLITIGQLRTFIELLPDWGEVAIGLDAIVLDSETDCAGWYAPGVVAICAWDHDLWDWWSPEMVETHRPILELLEVEQVPIEHSTEYHEYQDDLERWGDRNTDPAAGHVELRFTESQARAYQLLHILTHELGHHHDRITTRSQRRSARGEPYAEAYANRVADSIWPIYARTFGV